MRPGVCATSDGGFAVVGEAHSFGPDEIWLVKVDSMGNYLWDRLFEYGWGTGYSVIETKDKGLVIVGERYYAHLIVIRTDSLGNTLWSWPPYHLSTGTSIRQTHDGGYIIGVLTGLVKTTPEVGVGEGVGWMGFSLSVFPNPSGGVFDVVYSLSDIGEVRLDLFDGSGRRVKQLFGGSGGDGVHRLRFDLRDLGSGLYFLRLRAGKKERIKKVLIVR